MILCQNAVRNRTRATAVLGLSIFRTPAWERNVTKRARVVFAAAVCVGASAPLAAQGAAQGVAPYTAADVHFMSGMIQHHAQAVSAHRVILPDTGLRPINAGTKDPLAEAGARATLAGQ